jgi:predicted nucleic acid-binding protein
MPLRDALLTTAAQPFAMFLPLWSEAILDEMERNLASRRGPEKARRAVDVMRDAFPDSTVHVPPALIEEMPNHPKDRHVLAAAVACKADTLVTFNVRDFISAPDVGVAVLTPDAFLVELYQRDASTVLQAVAWQATALKRPPMSVADIARNLDRVGCCRFAALLQS